MEFLSADDRDFSLEMGDYIVRKVGEFDRMWKLEHGGSIATSPIAYNGVIYFAAADYCVYAVNSLDGELIWKFKTNGVIVEGSCIACNGMIYIGSFDKNVYAIDAITGELVWKFKTSDKIGSTPLVCEGVLYFGGKDHIVYALDAKTGILIWKFKTGNCIVSEPVVIGDRLIIGSYDRYLYCLDRNSGSVIWRLETQGEVHNVNTIPVRDGVLYFCSFDNFIRAVSVEDGRLLWKLSLGQYGLCVAPVLYKDTLYCPSRNGILYAVTLDGRIKWKFVTSDNIGVPCIAGDRIYVGSCDMHIHCIDLEGNEEWKFDTKSLLWWKPVLFGNKLIFGTWNCLLFCIDAFTQQVIWKFRVSGSPSPVPPANEAFSIELKVQETVVEEGPKKAYDLALEEKAGSGSFYKSRLVYQFTSQYKPKGQYQDDPEDRWL